MTRSEITGCDGTKHCLTSCAMRSDLAAALSDPERALPSHTRGGVNFGSYGTALTEPTVSDAKEAALSFMEHVLAAQNVT